jgi:hypothetical protein
VRFGPVIPMQAGAERDLRSWAADLGRRRPWHGWCLCLGVALLALALRAGP